MTLEMLRRPHGSVLGNPLLAEPLYLAKYIERMGTGTGDMIRRCQEMGLEGVGVLNHGWVCRDHQTQTTAGVGPSDRTSHRTSRRTSHRTSRSLDYQGSGGMWGRGAQEPGHSGHCRDQASRILPAKLPGPSVERGPA